MKNRSYILGSHSLKLPYSYSTDEVLEKLPELWFKKLPEKIQRMMIKFIMGSEIERRASYVPIETLFKEMDFETRNNLYSKMAIEFSEILLKEAFKKWKITATDIDFIITTSCTGIMIPSLDAYLANRLQMKPSLVRLPVTEMGCAGGTSALIYAHHIVQSNPKLKVLVLSFEFPSITLLKNDFSLENLVSTAIFADGAACVLLSGERDAGAIIPSIEDYSMYHFPNAEYLMGFNIVNEGLKIVLDKDVPVQIDKHFPLIVEPFLKKNQLTPSQVDHYLFHPGGKKIIQKVEAFAETYKKDVSDSKWILNQHGNMSSATILYILDRVSNKFKENPNLVKSGDTGYMLSFGPGFMAQSILLRWI